MFFLSIGHVSPLFYSLLARMGYFPVQELASFRKFGSRLQGHPCVEYGLPGVHVASGSLGQGLSAASGAALSSPNGIVVADDAIILVPFGGAAVMRVPLDGSAPDTIAMLPGGQLDGVVRTRSGDLLVSSWETSTVYSRGADGTTWCLHLRDAGGGRTRLVSRFRSSPAGPDGSAPLADPLEFLRERRMLRGLRTRAESGAPMPRTTSVCVS